MSILNKRIRDLTPEDLDQHTRYLGTEDFPFPMKKIVNLRNDDGSKVQAEVLGVLKNTQKGLALLSDLPQEKVDGMGFREMPAPSHLIYAQDMIMNAHATKGSRRIQYFKGTRGGGKTYAVEWLGRLMGGEGTDVINCGNADMSNLIFETVIDSGGNSIFDILDRKIKNNTLNPVTKATLKRLVGADAVSENGVDWEKAAEHASQKSDKDLSDEILKLAHTEEFGSGGNALGLSQRVGRFVKNLDEGRITLLDEYPRHKEGTDAGFHRLFEFVAGLIPDYYELSSLAEKNDPQGSVVNLKDDDRKVGSLVMLSGNTVEDGSDVHELPESVYSRVDVKNFTDLNSEDWQHRWGQFLTGAPLSTHYYAQHDKWKDDPDGFVEYYKAGLTRGLDPSQIDAIPEEYFKRIENFEDTLKATNILAEYMYGWADMMSQASLGSGFSELMMEVDEIFKAELSLDPRKIKRLVDLAKQVAPEVSLPSGIADKVVDDELENSESGRLLKAILDLTFMTTKKIGKDQTYERLQNLVETTDLMRVPDLLDQNPFISMNPRVQSKALRDYVCDTFYHHMGIDAPDDYDAIMTTSAADFAFAKISNPDEEDDIGMSLAEPEGADAPEVGEEETVKLAPEAYAPSVVILNDANPEMLLEDPFKQAFVVDKVYLLDGGTVEVDQDALGAPVAYESFMRSLVVPKMQRRNLQSFWDMALTESGNYSNDNESPPALAMAQSLDSARLAVTSLSLKDAFNQETMLHVFRNNDTNHVLFVGDSLPDDIRKDLQSARLEFVDKNQKDADEKIDAAIRKLACGYDEERMASLKDAFMLRNFVKGASNSEVTKASLGEIITSDNLETFMPRWVVEEKETLDL